MKPTVVLLLFGAIVSTLSAQTPVPENRSGGDGGWRNAKICSVRQPQIESFYGNVIATPITFEAGCEVRTLLVRCTIESEKDIEWTLQAGLFKGGISTRPNLEQSPFWGDIGNTGFRPILDVVTQRSDASRQVTELVNGVEHTRTVFTSDVELRVPLCQAWLPTNSVEKWVWFTLEWTEPTAHGIISQYAHPGRDLNINHLGAVSELGFTSKIWAECVPIGAPTNTAPELWLHTGRICEDPSLNENYVWKILHWKNAPGKVVEVSRDLVTWSEYLHIPANRDWHEFRVISESPYEPRLFFRFKP